MRLLGQMAAECDGREIALGPPRRRALLALLVMRLGHVVPAQQLLEELWCGRLPDRAPASLHSYISHLRRSLAPHAPSAARTRLVRRVSAGYVLDLSRDQVDTCRFEDAAAEGRRLHQERRHADARRRLDAALGLWRGTPFEELADYPALAEEGRRLARVRLSAVETWAEASLLLGDVEGVAELDAESRAHPGRERLAGQVMTAQYRLGRQADALAVYARTRDWLARELGVDAGQELQLLHTAILRQDLPGTPGDHAAAVPAARSARPPHPARPPQAGEAPPAGGPAARAPHAVPRPGPVDPYGLSGRDAPVDPYGTTAPSPDPYGPPAAPARVSTSDPAPRGAPAAPDTPGPYDASGPSPAPYGPAATTTAPATQASPAHHEGPAPYGGPPRPGRRARTTRPDRTRRTHRCPCSRRPALRPAPPPGQAHRRLPGRRRAPRISGPTGAAPGRPPPRSRSRSPVSGGRSPGARTNWRSCGSWWPTCSPERDGSQPCWASPASASRGS
ncbi:AfsR/SARP family transcriptional regulator [Streptomyces sp. CC210A]|uniref:AfsR/SARP family transcriptional regulator n=1 Tax=Streptomyces sp. CC210A TaxID=2898184 RepID=UPI001F229FDA|nr:AfsR/SARP family transcriptional regulator [Streptomyces sp. CC210A]